MKIFIIYLYLIILVCPLPYALRKDLTKHSLTSKDSAKKEFLRNLENDNYIIIYFNKDCYYPSGFTNIFRNNISYIFNDKTKMKYSGQEYLPVYRAFGIEIHFNTTIKSLYFFFADNMDENMKYLELVNFSHFNSNSVSNMAFMFYECSSLVSIDLTNFDTSQTTDMEAMFYECSSLVSIDLTNFDTSKVIYMEAMFYKCSSLVSIDVTNFDTSKVLYMDFMFCGCSTLVSIDVSNFDTSQTTYITSMFYGCSSLVSIDVSNFDTSQITDISYMFYNCSSLVSIDLSNFDTSNVNYMEKMFYNCGSLKSIKLSNFNTYYAINMSYMFYNCSSLKSINLSSFNTHRAIDMSYMFYNCSSLETINLSSFKTLRVINMSYMFYECSSLKSIDLSNFDMLSCDSFGNMFSNISSLKFINLYNFKNDKTFSNIFNNTNNSLFVCQKDNIIINPNIYNCCNSNFEPYDCIPSNNESDNPSHSESSIIETTIQTDTDILKTENIIISDSGESNRENIKTGNIIISDSGESNTENIISTSINSYNSNSDDIIPSDSEIKKNSNSSESISIGTIIGIIAGVVILLIVIFIIIIRKCFSNTQSSSIIVHEPENEKENPFIIIFDNPGIGNKSILIDSNKSIEELIRFYFEVIKRQDLYGDKNISFLKDGKAISPPYPKKSIETLTNKIVPSKTMKIVVADLQDKMKN